MLIKQGWCHAVLKLRWADAGAALVHAIFSPSKRIQLRICGNVGRGMWTHAALSVHFHRYTIPLKLCFAFRCHGSVELAILVCCGSWSCPFIVGSWHGGHLRCHSGYFRCAAPESGDKQCNESSDFPFGRGKWGKRRKVSAFWVETGRSRRIMRHWLCKLRDRWVPNQTLGNELMMRYDRYGKSSLFLDLKVFVYNV